MESPNGKEKKGRLNQLEDGIKEQVEGKRTTLTEMMLGESRVMCRWRSSLWKLLWRELLVYTLAFFFISFIYRYALSFSQQTDFERLARWCNKMYSTLPITFLLGFYVSLVVKRWWEQYCKLPWPDSLCFYLRGLVIGDGPEPRLLRRTVVRYCMLSYVLCIKRVSARLRRRFPSMQEVVRCGLARPDEAHMLGTETSAEMYGSNWWMPMQWATSLITGAQGDGLIKSAPGFSGLLGQISAFRTSLTDVATYGHIPVPLVYTQVVTLAVYIHFAVSLIGEQWLLRRKTDPMCTKNCKWTGDEIDLYYPIFMTIKFLFYMGWLRVADTLYNPFGEDDDDFELNELINRHFRVGMSIVDSTKPAPPLRRDVFWDQAEPVLDDFPAWSDEYAATMAQMERDYDTPEGKEGANDEAYMMPMEQRDPMM